LKALQPASVSPAASPCRDFEIYRGESAAAKELLEVRAR
jgi:hypothetical protein